LLNDVTCEVIGCDRRACWLLVVRQDSCNEDFLCHVHWELLRDHDSRQAGCYVYLSSLLAEGKGLTSAGAVAHPRQVCGLETNPDALGKAAGRNLK
jgi:hypothetical protein